jgi:DNA-binding PadR family transcriptional regulator
VRPAVVEGIAEPAVLTLLAESPAHGYDLARAMEERGLVPGSMPRGRIYAVLATLEEEGAVRGAHEAGADGPDRKRYAITARGRARLSRWITALKGSEVALKRLIATSSKVHKR